MNVNPDEYPEIKPCPFCGSRAELTGECDLIWVRCSNDDCRAERIWKFDEPEEAIENWNKREIQTDAGKYIRIEPYQNLPQLLKQLRGKCCTFGDVLFDKCLHVQEKLKDDA